MIIAAHPENHRVRNAGVVAGVTAAHLLVFMTMARMEPSPPAELPTPPVLVELIRPIIPPPPPPPPPPAPPSPVSGGGAPAAPSRVHTPPPPQRPMPIEVPAPKVQAPEPALVIGVSDKASPTPGMGQGGQGTGTGSGVGAGNGPGSGVRTGPRNLRRPTNGDILRYVPREARAQRVPGIALVRCRIRRDQSLHQCAVVSERPGGYGFGAAAIAVAEQEYRFQPATLDGVYQDDVTVVVTVEFGRMPPEG